MSAVHRRVLVVSFFYPPDPAVGGRRVAKFVEYLPEFGWSPAVLTAQATASPAPSARVPAAPVHATRFLSPWKAPVLRAATRTDTSSVALRERLGGSKIGATIYGALRHLLPMSSVRMPDATLGWVPFALREGRRLLGEGDFDAILSSAGPPSSHIVASRLSRGSGTPWLADYRDLWSDNHWDRRIEPFQRLERRLERRVVAPAAALTATSSTFARRLAELHGRGAEVIYNGFDPADYPEPRSPESFTLLYVGTLTWPHQSPEPLLTAVERLARDDPAALADAGFTIEFLGTDRGVVEGLAARHGVSRWIRRSPPVDHRESLARQRSAGALLFLPWRDPEVGAVQAKLFEYLGAGRPILSVGPRGGDVSRILEECGSSAPTADPEGIAAKLHGWIERFRRAGDRPPGIDPGGAAARYTRRAQTRRLASLLEDLIR